MLRALLAFKRSFQNANSDQDTIVPVSVTKQKHLKLCKKVYPSNGF